MKVSVTRKSIEAQEQHAAAPVQRRTLGEASLSLHHSRRQVLQRQRLSAIFGDFDHGKDVDEQIAPRGVTPGPRVAKEAYVGSPQLSASPMQFVEDEELEEDVPIQAKVVGSTATVQCETGEQAAPHENRTGMPDQLKANLEAMSGFDLSDVRVYRNSEKPAQLSALAYAQGNEIHLGPGQEQHLPHEAWHVVQQRQGRVRANLQTRDVGINTESALEGEADLMGYLALHRMSRSVKPAAPKHRGAMLLHPPVQCNYASLHGMGRARVDQLAEQDYASKSLKFELGMAHRIMGDPTVHKVVDHLLRTVREIVHAWASHTGQTKAMAYEQEFGWPPGDSYYGAFETTARNVKAILYDSGKPMRLKLKLIYNAVRNNNLAKWLKLAANELHREAQGKTARNWRITSDSGQVVDAPGHLVPSATAEHTVTVGFAQDSNLSGLLSKREVAKIAATLHRERQTAGWFSSTRRDIFSQEGFSDVAGWQESTKRWNKERRRKANRNLDFDHQRTLTVGEVPDLTDEEIDLMLKKEGIDAPSSRARKAFRKTAGKKLPWSQGGEFYDVKLGSESARAAAEVNARMEAGISGSTDLMLHAARYLGLNDKTLLRGLRLALAGWMMANRDHSFYEVFKAAEAYELPFDLDPLRPGAEYESTENLYPMERSNFTGILEDDGVLRNVFPKDYLSSSWKDHLAATLQNSAKTKTDIKESLRKKGISHISLDIMTERDTAALAQLDGLVAAQVINAGDPKQVKKQVVRRLRQHVAFIYLGNTFGEARAAKLLNSLLLHYHPDKDVTDSRCKVRLEEAGIPRVILDFVTPSELGRIDAVRLAVQNADVGWHGIEMRKIDEALGALSLPDHQKLQIKAVLIRKYREDGFMPEGVPYADVLNRIAQIEQIACMERTTGTWYSWGSPESHQRNIKAASLREATASVKSPTQGPGLYVGRTILTSATYGQELGKRVLVVKMNGVPTINENNIAQVTRLGLLGSNRGHKLERVGLYNSDIRSEFLMIYGSGGFARLTTNKGVTLTMDLKVAPDDELKTAYKDFSLWPGKSRENFQQQAAECGLAIRKWPTRVSLPSRRGEMLE